MPEPSPPGQPGRDLWPPAVVEVLVVDGKPAIVGSQCPRWM